MRYQQSKNVAFTEDIQNDAQQTGWGKIKKSMQQIHRFVMSGTWEHCCRCCCHWEGSKTD